MMNWKMKQVTNPVPYLKASFPALVELVQVYFKEQQPSLAGIVNSSWKPNERGYKYSSSW
jgi:hypothetical protein